MPDQLTISEQTVPPFFFFSSFLQLYALRPSTTSHLHSSQKKYTRQQKKEKLKQKNNVNSKDKKKLRKTLIRYVLLYVNTTSYCAMALISIRRGMMSVKKRHAKRSSVRKDIVHVKFEKREERRKKKRAEKKYVKKWKKRSKS